MRTVLSFAVGALELALVLLVLRHLARFGRAFPWLAALMAFFLLGGIDRIYLTFVSSAEYSIVLLLDCLLLVVVALLALRLDNTIRALRAAEDAAQHGRREYARALRDYRRVTRHRLANPLAAIHGSITAPQDLPSPDDEARSSLLNVVDQQVRRLEEVKLEPTVLTKEEETLRPLPDTR